MKAVPEEVEKMLDIEQRESETEQSMTADEIQGAPTVFLSG